LLLVDLFDPFRPEHRLTARPSRRRRSALADRLEQDTTAIRMEVRKRRSRAESARQPRPRSRADQPLVEEAESSEVRQAILAEVEGTKRDQHADERLDHVQAAVVRHLQTQMIELLVKPGLGADRGGFAFVASPAFERVAAAISHIERPTDVALRSFREARKLLHLRDQHRAACRLAGPRNHEPDSFCPGGIMRLGYLRYG